MRSFSIKTVTYSTLEMCGIRSREGSCDIRDQKLYKAVGKWCHLKLENLPYCDMAGSLGLHVLQSPTYLALTRNLPKGL